MCVSSIYRAACVCVSSVYRAACVCVCVYVCELYRAANIQGVVVVVGGNRQVCDHEEAVVQRC